MKIVIQSNNFASIAAGLEARASAVVAKTALDVEARAKTNAPVDTGFLRNSIATETNGLTATVSVGAEYAVYQEYGTRFQAAQPFLIPAVEVVRPAFYEAMRQLFEMRG